jgi:hypothetical protein
MNGESINRVAEEIEYLRARRARTGRARPRLTVVHGYHQAIRDCFPGETVEYSWLSVHSDVFPLRVSPTGLVLVDVLARKKPLALTAAQIERIITSDPFYVNLGANAASAQRARIGLTRRTIKVYIPRLLRQIGKALKKAGLAMRPEEILVTEDTDLLNVKAYRLAISCEFVHLNRTAGAR